MMLRIVGGAIVGAALASFATIAMAQQSMSPAEQALGSKLMSEITAGLQCNSALIVAQKQIAEAQARIKALEDKYEPKPNGGN